jgi:hypothetical protein
MAITKFLHMWRKSELDGKRLLAVAPIAMSATPAIVQKDSAKRRRLKTAGFREAAEMAKVAKAATSILLTVSGHNGQNFRCCAQRWRWPHHLGIWLLG